jgi:regulator of protease activity HflC (stomatin/prohibitin superfamily)
MTTNPPQAITAEKNISAMSGAPVLMFNLLLLVGAVVYLLTATPVDGGVTALRVLLFVVAELAAVLMLFGYFTLQPNEARVQILFGTYKGTVRRSGFYWANPFYSRARGRAAPGSAAPPTTGLQQKQAHRAGIQSTTSLSTKLSLRAHNFNSETLKVNDKRGNPVEIAAVVVWRVEDTAQAVFDVEDYTSYVQVQSESAIRSVASRYAYDHGEVHELTLRGGADEVAHALKEELQVRLAKAGVTVEEARLTHLAYAPEIAGVMLRRQQAEAIVAARQIIVHNAVSMVHMALRELDEKAVVKLDDERKAAMVSNLLVVLCGSSDPSPVINTGTLYT